MRGNKNKFQKVICNSKNIMTRLIIRIAIKITEREIEEEGCVKYLKDKTLNSKDTKSTS